MITRSYLRGHPIVWIDEMWVYEDTKESTVENERPWCRHCKKEDTPEGHDGCIGVLNSDIVMNACCGHEEPQFAYVQFWPIRFLRFSLWKFRILQFPLWLRQRISGDEATEFIDSDEFKDLNNVNVCGVMGMATYTENEDTIRSEFKELVHIFNQLKNTCFSNVNFKEISMGMSGDYKIAIEEGATMVRIGSLLFGARNY